MIEPAALLDDLKRRHDLLVADLTDRAEDTADPENSWAPRLRKQFADATRRARTGLSWIDWRDSQIDQAAAAWLVATTFVRFCEDNRLLDGARLDGEPVPTRWLAGPGDGTERAVEHQASYLRTNPTHNRRDWMLRAFETLRAQPAGRALLTEHSPVWTAWPSAEAATNLVDFWRTTDDSGDLVHDFTDPDLDTRFLGDIYQGLSEHARKTYALLQTPEFVEKFILDRTLTPALGEFGLSGPDGSGFRLIDPTCGSGHFLLGAFERLDAEWKKQAPNLAPRERVRKAMGSIHGVDLNPFAVAIARFRLTVAGLKAAGDTSLVGAAPLGFHLAVGDSLLAAQGKQQEFPLGVAPDEDPEPWFAYDAEDVTEYQDILAEGTYHTVVGNPPYITVKDKALNQAYRHAYSTCHRQYALSVPFAELFFRLAVKGEPGVPAGYVGQITSNSFMKREFGKKLIEDMFSGRDVWNPVDLLDVVDTSGAYIPGHGTPTVILIGRRQRPQSDTVHAVLGVRGEPAQPTDPARGLVWTEITEHIDGDSFDGTYVSVASLDRKTLATHPWSLSGGGASALKAHLEAVACEALSGVIDGIGSGAVTREDSAYVLGSGALRRAQVPAEKTRALVEGEFLRDWVLSDGAIHSLWPYSTETLESALDGPSEAVLWPLRLILRGRVAYGKTQLERGLQWYEYSVFFPDRYRRPLSIALAFVATHNHFVLDRGGKVFKQSAPVISLPKGASEQDHLDLLGALNSSTACFWLKQSSYAKSANSHGDPWEERYEFAATKLQEFPLPAALPGTRSARLDSLAQQLAATTPTAVIADLAPGLRDELRRAQEDWHRTRTQMIAEQEELDWEVYRLYGLIDEDLTYSGEVPELSLGERAFEIALARRVAEGSDQTAWFERHGSTPITELPGHWSADYRDLVQRRLDLITANPQIALLERPEYKRRWATHGWDALLQDALREAILGRLEKPDLWRDANGPVVRSLAQLAVALRSDKVLAELASLYSGQAEPDLLPVLTELVPAEAVPYLAAHRYKEPGLAKYHEWQHVWDLQRREDAGEELDVSVPPKYTKGDFRKPSYWNARGKLDVPKERFILYPEVARTGDATPALGWAGWDHADQARALLREVLALLGDPEAEPRLRPLLAGLAELEPWLHQWHAERGPDGELSAAEQVSGALTGLLAQLGWTREELNAWRPPAPVRRKRKASA